MRDMLKSDILALDLSGEVEEIEHTYRHHTYRTCNAHAILSEAHAEGEHCAAEETHDHKTRHFVLLSRLTVECLREDYREDVGVAEPYQCNAGKHEQLRRCDKHEHHSKDHCDNTDDEEELG